MKLQRDPHLLQRLPTVSDARGGVSFLEEPTHLPFTLRRVYWLHGLDRDHPRGFHAHRELEQVVLAASGALTLVLDDGQRRWEHRLQRPDEGVYVGPGLWRELHDFAPGSTLLVLASHPHDEADYIRDYDAFVATANARRGLR